MCCDSREDGIQITKIFFNGAVCNVERMDKIAYNVVAIMKPAFGRVTKKKWLSRNQKMKGRHICQADNSVCLSVQVNINATDKKYNWIRE